MRSDTQKKWSRILYKAPWRCMRKLRELAENLNLHGFQFKATAIQHKQLCSSATYPHVLPILNLSLLFWPALSTKSQLPAFHIPQSWRHNLQFFPSHTPQPLQKTGIQRGVNRCIKSICCLNLLQTGGRIRLAADAIQWNLASELWRAKLLVKCLICQ